MKKKCPLSGHLFQASTQEGKWCEYHKIPWNKTEECCSKKSLMVKLKAFELEVDSDSKSNPKGGKCIIYVEPSVIVATTNA
jgi:hypothetical protein